MSIRLEQPQDWREVENLTREAFWNVYRPGCQEHFVLNQYRSNPAFIPELDFVMEEDGRIIGHIMFSKAEITLADGTSFPSWTFGPISIHPDCKRKGYGLKLLRYALEKAKEMGIGLLQMEGNIEFYRHAGFDLASKLRIHYHGEPADAEVPYFLAQELIPGYWGDREGTYCPPAGYFAADAQPEAFAAYDAGFPPKEKHLAPGQLPQFCQSCGMPLTKDEDCGHDADGSINFDYCQYCYQDGKFLQDCTMNAGKMNVSVQHKKINMAKIYDFKALNNKGAEMDFAQYEGKVLMIVNTASKCGFTPQYDGLEALYQKYKDQGLVIVGFPCDQFAHQEPGTDEEIAEFCRINHGVTFQLMAKVDVNGANAEPIFEYLKAQAPTEEYKGLKAKATHTMLKGLSKSVEKDSDILWNFTKFLICRDGSVVKRYAPTTEPKDIEQDINSML